MSNEQQNNNEIVLTAKFEATTQIISELMNTQIDLRAGARIFLSENNKLSAQVHALQDERNRLNGEIEALKAELAEARQAVVDQVKADLANAMEEDAA